MSRQAWKRAAAKAATVIAATSFTALMAGAASAETGHYGQGHGHQGHGQAQGYPTQAGPAPQFGYGGGYFPQQAYGAGAPYGLPPSALSAPIYSQQGYGGLGGYGGFGGYGGYGGELAGYGGMFGYGEHHGYGAYAPAEPDFAPAEPYGAEKTEPAKAKTTMAKPAMEAAPAPAPQYVEVEPNYVTVEVEAPAPAYSVEIEPSSESTYIGSSTMIESASQTEKDPYQVLLEAEMNKSTYSAGAAMPAAPAPQPYYEAAPAPAPVPMAMPAPVAVAPMAAHHGMAVQVAAFRDAGRAQQLVDKLRAAGEQAYVAQAVVRGTLYNRVRVAAGDKASASMARDRIHGLGYYEARVVRG